MSDTIVDSSKMKPQGPVRVEIPEQLIEALRTFPLEREVEHCGHRWAVSPFEVYANCPHCSSRIKLRAYSAGNELEDVFDAVFEWLRQPCAAKLLDRRQKSLQAEDSE